MDWDLLPVDEISRKLMIKKSWFYSRSRETGQAATPRIKVGKYFRFNFFFGKGVAGKKHILISRVLRV